MNATARNRSVATPPRPQLVTTSPRPLVKTEASVLLDLVRGLAALIVLVSHWRNYLFQDYPQLSAHPPAVKLFYLLTSAGHQAVVIFFVLSGYLISGSIFRMIDRGTWSWSAYLLHRFVRLWIVLIPGLLLCVLWDCLGLHFHLAPALYGGAYYNHMTRDIPTLLSPRIFAENLFFLQGVRGLPMLGSDGALWSLANEFWYYLLFPLGLIAAWRPNRPLVSTPTRIACAFLFGLIAWFVRGGILWMFPVWLAGTVLCLLPTLRLSPQTRLLAGALYLPILYALSKWQTLSVMSADYFLTAATCALLYILLSATGPCRPSTGERASRKLASFSYTLYVVHMPFLLFLTAIVARDSRWQADPRHLLYAAGLLLLTLGYAYSVASVTEFHTDTVRRWVERGLRLSR